MCCKIDENKIFDRLQMRARFRKVTRFHSGILYLDYPSLSYETQPPALSSYRVSKCLSEYWICSRIFLTLDMLCWARVNQLVSPVPTPFTSMELGRYSAVECFWDLLTLCSFHHLFLSSGLILLGISDASR